MIKDKTVVGIITARAHSKRLPEKNTKLLVGESLVTRTCITAKKSTYIDRLIVSTDSTKIAKLAVQQNVEAPFLRPQHISQDTSTTEEAVIHALMWVSENENEHYDYVVILQPTSPFRTAHHIDEALEVMMINGNADALVSVSNFSKKALWMKRIDSNGYLVNVIENEEYPTYFPNGAIYIVKTAPLLQFATVYQKKTIPYVMDHISSLDIDTQEDFEMAGYIMNSRLHEKTN